MLSTAEYILVISMRLILPERIVGELEKHTIKEVKATIVMDTGIEAKENIEWLKEKEYNYIVVNRGKPPVEIDFKDMSVIKEDIEKGVKIEVKRFEEEGEVYLFVKSEGTYVLRTNRLKLTDKQIWQTYIMLGRIETAFKDMKSHLGLRPNFHQKGERVDAHIFISVLAYHLMHGIEYRLKLAGDSSSWQTIKNIFRTHERMTIEYISKDEEGILYNNKLRLNSRLEPEHLVIYTKLGLSGRPLERRLLTRKIGSDNKPRQVLLRE